MDLAKKNFQIVYYDAAANQLTSQPTFICRGAVTLERRRYSSSGLLGIVLVVALVDRSVQ